MGATQVTTI
jgi:predicted unusual protein kinase regulating ubiquinone biosynthesis (AarF/ABC1/UbiB family)